MTSCGWRDHIQSENNEIVCFLFSGSADTKSYIITSQLDPGVYRKHVEDTRKLHLTGFTFVVIGIVHLAGGKITEGIMTASSRP